MIRVVIEMDVAGLGLIDTYHVIEIDNDVETSLKDMRKGSYNYRISRKLNSTQSNLINQSPRKWRSRLKPPWHKGGKIKNFPRANKNAVHLLAAVLKDAGY